MLKVEARLSWSSSPSSLPPDTRASLLPTDPCPHLRLVGGLASENVRWAESVGNFRSQGATLCGDVLLISAFVSYVGYFTKKYRNELMEGFWIPYINKLKVGRPVAPITQHLWGAPGRAAPARRHLCSCNGDSSHSGCRRWPCEADADILSGRAPSCSSA